MSMTWVIGSKGLGRMCGHRKALARLHCIEEHSSGVRGRNGSEEVTESVEKRFD